MQAEIVLVAERAEDRGRDGADAGLDAVAIAQQVCDMLANRGRGFVHARRRQRRRAAVALHHVVDRLFVDARSARRRRQTVVQLGHNQLRRREHRVVKVRVRTKAQIALGIPRDLDERDVQVGITQVVEDVPHVHRRKPHPPGGVALPERGRQEEGGHRGIWMQRREVGPVHPRQRKLQEAHASRALRALAKTRHQRPRLVGTASHEDGHARCKQFWHRGGVDGLHRRVCCPKDSLVAVVP